MSPVPPTVQPHLLEHAAAMKAFTDSLESEPAPRQQAALLFIAAAALVDAGKALANDAGISCPHAGKGPCPSCCPHLDAPRCTLNDQVTR